MKIKLWDQPLTQARVFTAVRILDSTISEGLIRALFMCLKNEKDLVPVSVLI